MRPSFVLVRGWCLRSGEAWCHRRGKPVGERVLAGDTSYKFTTVKMDGTRNGGPEGVGQQYRNLKHWMVEFLGEFWSEALAA